MSTLPANAAPTEVLVVGGGPTGLMTAVLLARLGVRVRVFDKNAQQAHESRALGVQARTMELFLSLGLDAEMLARGTLVPGLRLFEDGHPRAEISLDDLGRDDTPFSFFLVVPQRDTEAVLLGELRRLGVEVERSVEVTGFAQTAEGVTLRARGADGAEGEARGVYLVGADGAHSIVRKTLGLSFEGAAYPQDFLLADCRIDWPLGHDRLMIFLNGKHLAVHFPLVDRYREGRVFVAGDAAHIHSPAGGQGMNTGLQDAANLAWKLALALRGPVVPDLLDSYHAERWPVGRRVLEYTDKLFSTMTSPSGFVAGVRNAVLPRVVGTLMHFGFVREKAFHFVSELGIHYGEGVCAREAAHARETGFWKHGPAAGHRAPNALCARHRDVFGLLTGYGFHVLALSRQPLTGEEIARLGGELVALPRPGGVPLEAHVVGYVSAGHDERVLRAESSQVFAAYGVDHATPRALYLVRPDGYVVWRADNLDTAGLGEFLRGRFAA